MNPDVIFVEKDASFKVIEMLMQDGRTVVTNTQAKLLEMIARATQTIICPNHNFISTAFKIGKCGLFKIVQKKGFEAADQYTANTTSMLYLEGTDATLGCSIVLSGSDKTELETVKEALLACIKQTRSLLLQSEYLKFIKPSI